MTKTEKYEALKEFLLYHCHNNPKRTLHDILPLLNELLHTLREPTIKEKK